MAEGRFVLESDMVFVAEDEVDALKRLARHFAEMAKQLERGGQVFDASPSLQPLHGKLSVSHWLGKPSGN